MPITIAGAGLGLRAKHFDTILTEQPPVPWFEVVADQFMHSNGIIIDKLEQISRHYPLVLHCLGCSVGSTDPLNLDYLNAVKSLAQRINAAWVSDHCCWVCIQGQYLFDLMPLPLTQAVATHVAVRARMIQDHLERPFALENVSAYLAYRSSEMTEPQFLNHIATQADIKLLLDINNVYVNAHNQGSNATAYFTQLDPAHIVQMHLAGYEQHGDLLIDTHSQAVHTGVWALYQQALTYFGAVPTCIEWDSQIPDWPTYVAEQQQAAAYLQAAPIVPTASRQTPCTVTDHDITALTRLQSDLREAVWSACHDKDLALKHLAHPAVEAKQRLQVYHHSIIGNILTAYRRIFSATRKLVGDEYLTHLIEDYLQHTTCTHPDITAGAAGLIDFVHTHHPTQQAVPYLADFMDFEWHWYQAFHRGEAAPPLTLHTRYPLAEIWAMCQPEYQGEPHWPECEANDFHYQFICHNGKVLVLLKESQT
jgi:uncharacterized protein (UPF0276 family)